MNERMKDRKLTTADLASMPPPNSSEYPPGDEPRSQPPRVAGNPRPSEVAAGVMSEAQPWPGNADGEPAQLFPRDDLGNLRSRWTEIQSRFVDEPRKSVEEADSLVASTIQRLADSFAKARSGLEGQCSRGNDVSTEDLRVALRQYRTFFDRMLAM